MSSSIAVSVVVAAYNEEARLEPTLRAMLGYFRSRALDVEVIVVDDGSSDGTTALVERLAGAMPELRAVRLAPNHGKGYAVRAGVGRARGALVLCADADGAAPIEEIERLEAALAAGADVAIGSRALGGEGVRVVARLHRRLIGRVFHQLVKLLAVRGFRDTQCGFKLFRAVAARDLFPRLRVDGFGYDVELLVLAQRRGYRVTEVPVNWRHQPGSHLRLVRDSLRMARDLWAIRARARRGDE